jgi:ABC-2 type transport system ATP-binding protein
MSLLRLEQLVCRFGATTAVDGVDLAVGPGEVVGLLGANGAGKTTTIRMALGLQRPTSGQVELLGGPPSRQARHGIGYVPQGLGLWQDLTVAQNLTFVASAYGVVPPPLPPGLTRAAHTTVADLPLGERRRVAFVAALGHDPALLVLDEPTSGVGPLERTHLWDDVHAAREAGTGVLVTTHHMSEAEQCDRVVVLMRGRVVASGTMADLLDGRSTVVVTTEDWPEAFTRLDRSFDAVALQGRTVRVPDADPARVRGALGDMAAQVAIVPASFDEVFVTLGHTA